MPSNESATLPCIANPAQAVYEVECWKWLAPQQDKEIVLRHSALECLTRDLKFGRRAPGQLSGGLLFGSCRPNRITIEGIDSYCCNDLYNVLGIVKDRLDQQRVAAGLGLASHAIVVGYYRIVDMEPLIPSEADHRLIGEHCGQPESLFLLLRNAPSGSPMGGVFCWKAKEITYIPAKFPSLPEVSDPLLDPPAHDNTLGYAGKKRKLWAITGAAILAIGALTWSSTGRTVQTAAAAKEYAFNKASQRRLATTEEVRPSTVAALNEVRSGIASGAHADGPVANLPASAAHPVSSGAAMRELTSTMTTPKTPAQGTPASSASTRMRVGVAAQPPKPFQPPPNQPAAVRTPARAATWLETSDPPVVALAAPSVTLMPAPAAPLPDAKGTVPPPPAEPAHRAGARPPRVPTGPPPDVRIAGANDFVPPRPIKQVRPLVSREIAEVINRDVVIQVRLLIDATGKVVTAEAPFSDSALERLLGKISEETARMWRFEPARSGNHAVPSNGDVQFKFRVHR